MRPSLTAGRWFDVATAAEHANLRRLGDPRPQANRHYSQARVLLGEFAGPGRYLVLNYTQRCPRNCCDDDVRRVIPAADVAAEVREEMRELADLLREARTPPKLTGT